jgi:hypothetical protein
MLNSLFGKKGLKISMKWNDKNWKTIFEVKDNEISVCPGEFWDMRKSGLFEKEYYDKEEPFKLVGITKDGKTYVTEKPIECMTKAEYNEYNKRCPEEDDEIFSHLTIDEILELRKKATGIIV